MILNRYNRFSSRTSFSGESIATIGSSPANPILKAKETIDSGDSVSRKSKRTSSRPSVEQHSENGDNQSLVPQESPINEQGELIDDSLKVTAPTLRQLVKTYSVKQKRSQSQMTPETTRLSVTAADLQQGRHSLNHVPETKKLSVLVRSALNAEIEASARKNERKSLMSKIRESFQSNRDLSLIRKPESSPLAAQVDNSSPTMAGSANNPNL
jgi:hypothetical protein